MCDAAIICEYVLHIYIYMCHTAIICESYLTVTQRLKQADSEQVQGVGV